MLSREALEQARRRSEQRVGEAAASLAMRTASVLEAFCARNKRAAGKVAGLLAGVEVKSTIQVLPPGVRCDGDGLRSRSERTVVSRSRAFTLHDVSTPFVARNPHCLVISA